MPGTGCWLQLNPAVTLALPAGLRGSLEVWQFLKGRARENPSLWEPHWAGLARNLRGSQLLGLGVPHGGSPTRSVYRNLGMDLQLQMFSLVLLRYRFTVGTQPNCVLISKQINEQGTVNAAPFPSHSVNLHFPRQVSAWYLFQHFTEIGCGVICTQAR